MIIEFSFIPLTKINSPYQHTGTQKMYFIYSHKKKFLQKPFEKKLFNARLISALIHSILRTRLCSYLILLSGKLGHLHLPESAVCFWECATKTTLLSLIKRHSQCSSICFSSSLSPALCEDTSFCHRLSLCLQPAARTWEAAETEPLCQGKSPIFLMRAAGVCACICVWDRHSVSEDERHFFLC